VTRSTDGKGVGVAKGRIMAVSSAANIRFNHVGVMVPDMDAAIAWYARMFGTSVLDRWDNPEVGMEWAHVSLGDMVIEFVRMPDLAPQSARTYALHHFALTVPDCDTLVLELQAMGVEVTRPPSDFDRHAIRWAFVKDLLGNVIEIMSPLPAKAAVNA